MGIHQIRKAEFKDSTAIYKLISEAFDESYLSYTIYQSPKSVKYISSLISEISQENKHYLMVLVDDLHFQVKGYYHATLVGEQLFLNYIAVSGMFAGKGLGYSLLSHYEDTGIKVGINQFGLDVFENNQFVKDWYMKHGYKQEFTSFFAHIAFDSLGGTHDVLVLDENEWEKALNDEINNGFSKITCKYGQGFITLGLINGNRYRLLGYEGMTLDDAIGVVKTSFRNRCRDTLIVSSSKPLTNKWSIVRQDCIVRLVKNG